MRTLSHDPRRRARVGLWRTALAIPAIAASTLLLVFLLGPLGAWSGLVLAGWLATGALTLTPGGERYAVRVLCRFRAPARGDWARIEPTLIAVLDRHDLGRDDVDLYVRRKRKVNAYAAGRRSIAVTSALVTHYRDGTLDDAVLAGVLSHELGHLVGRDCRWVLATTWLAAPWRSTYRLGGRLAALLARYQPRPLLALVIVTGFALASYQAIQHGDWTTATVLCALAVCPVAVPVADAALSRSSEYAADAQAVRAGYQSGLAAALRRAGQSGVGSRSWILQHHPPTRRRLDRMVQSVFSAKANVAVADLAQYNRRRPDLLRRR